MTRGKIRQNVIQGGCGFVNRMLNQRNRWSFNSLPLLVTLEVTGIAVVEAIIGVIETEKAATEESDADNSKGAKKGEKMRRKDKNPHL